MILEKKKIKFKLGKLDMRSDHPFIVDMEHNFCISPLLQSLTLEYAHQLPFKRAMDLLNSACPRANMNGSQSQRLMQYYGNLEETEEELQRPGFEQQESAKNEDEILYALVDGGHVLTDDDYRETKLGRIFKSSQIKQISSDNENVIRRNELERSDYIANFGYYKLFTDRFDPLISNHLDGSNYTLVLISDGAEWISNWQLEKYPNAVMILDFYHALEHLCSYAKMIFKSKTNKACWIAQRKGELLNGDIDKVIAAIQERCIKRRSTIKKAATDLTNYYENNKYRMKYNEYLEKGYCIGSGAIESAISTVVQQRCKLIGQRWTIRIAAVLNIRAIYMSNKKERLLRIISKKMGQRMAA